MKTIKTNLNSVTLAVALAVAGLVVPARPTHSQSNVYSINVVGYVSQTLTNCYAFIANPLDTTNNSLRRLIPAPPEGTRVWLWNVDNQAFDPPATFANQDWSMDLDLPVGRGFVIHSPTNFTITFVGEVLQGWLTNPVAGNNRLSLLGSKVPQAAPLSAELEFPGSDGDEVYLVWPTDSGFLDACTYYADYGWFDPRRTVGPDGPVIEVGRAFFVRHPGPDTNWVRNFWVPDNQPNRASSIPGVTVPRILGLALRAGAVTLELSKTGTPYDVQWSGDGVAWTTLAVNQTGTTWTGRYPGGAQGYYRATNPAN